ncbi:outer membrane protein assembly factor BamB family protein [Actinacidiphila bryophytorum]|uniref:PQQ-binding-like beta-propeller repeat protein n=1 Tax=Actinacidiphila bryophytorum TaxID=1436133 RepID=A0A9W4GZ12_9ACTN|nr:PQQ-binding-like beta-propeller repeat protein [Actinacidiphila bryophytorum]MBM9437933.1 PQQ-binding-like beta-propeller repeat protein [Actinacidiphila bryophytorum]MBN6542822.1 PQQ-binding-like beta-propeller repeat protein [Actinacidiphila bryophytorum]CAG7623512.1 PQQ-binding-like beta-propeller repeat protein [Actinacidiphila bryophytorum]
MVWWRRAITALTALASLLAVGGTAVPAATAATAASAASASAAPQTWDRGTIPLYSTTSAGGETARMPDGSVRTYLAVSGKPAYLAEVDTFSGKVLRMIPLYVPGSSAEDPPDTGAQGAWGVSVDKRGTVFVSTYGFGHVYRLPWKAAAVEDLGRPSPRTSFTWEGDTDNQGVFYFGTSQFFGPAPLPGGRLFSWDPATRKYRDYGDFGAAYGYVRSVEYADGKIYAGLGPSTALWQVDPRSGRRVEIPPPAGMPTDKYAYQLEDEGGYLYVLFAGGTTAQVGWVLDLRTLRWTHEIPGYAGQTVTGADARGRVYLVDSGELKRYDPRRGVLTPTGFAGGSEQADKGGLGAGKGLARATDPATGHETIVGATSGGDLWRYDTVTGTGTFGHLDGLRGTPTAPRSLATGPDGRVYAGGYFQGGLAVYDPATTTWTSHPFPHQIEGMSAHAGKMYFGVYPNAQLWEYDPAQPWGDANPRLLFDLKQEGQERPWTVVSAGPYLAVGTSPKNSRTDGAVTLYDPSTGQRRTYTSGLVTGANQISALAYRDGVLYGGSLGCCNFDGSKHPGQVFALDAASGDVLWRSTPLPQEQGVAGLTFDGRGRLFGQTYGTVFELDPATGALVRSVQEFAYDWSVVANFQPRAVNMAWDAGDDSIYTTNGVTRRISPDTLADAGPNFRTSFASVAPGPSKFYVQGGNLLEVRWY